MGSRMQGWPLVLCGTLMCFVTNGLMRVNGVLFPALMSAEGLTRGQASWPLNLPGAAIVVMAPVTGFLTSRFSPVCITAVGSLVFTLGILPCYFSTNLVVLSVSFGIIRGCGSTMILIAIPSMIATVFKHNRSTAMGIATSGMPIAGLVLPLLTQFFLDEYGLRGTFLLLTGVALQAFVGCVGLMSYKRVLSVELPARKAPKNHKEDDTTTLLNPGKTYGSIVTREEPQCVSDGTLPSGKANTSANDSSFGTEEKSLSEPVPSLEVGPALDGKSQRMSTTGDPQVIVPTETESPSRKNPADAKEAPPLKRLNLDKATLRKIFTTRGFYCLTITQMFTVYLGATFSQVIVDYSADKGLRASWGVWILTVTSCGEIAGRLCLGWLTDKKYISNANQIIVSLTLCSIVAVVCTFTKAYWLLVSSAVILGICQGSALSVNLVQVADYFTREEIPLALSYARMFSGLSALTRAPVIGVFRDQLGSYDNLIRTLAAATLLTALMWFIEGFYVHRNKPDYKSLEEAHN